MGAALLADPDKIEAVNTDTLFKFLSNGVRKNIYSVYILNKIDSITLNLQILAKLVTGVSIPVTCKIRILPSVISENIVMFSFIGTVAPTNFIVFCGLSWRIPSVLFRGLRRLALQPSLSMAGKFLLS